MRQSQAACEEQPYEKMVPGGAWVKLNQLPAKMTDVELNECLASVGIWVPVENISIRHFPDGHSVGKISIPNDSVVALVEWLLKDKPIKGREIVATVWPCKSRELAAKGTTGK